MLYTLFKSANESQRMTRLSFGAWKWGDDQKYLKKASACEMVMWSPSGFLPGTRVSSQRRLHKHNYWCQQAWLIEVVCTCSKINEVWMKIDENTSPRAIYCAITIEISIKFKSLSGCSTGFQGSIQESNPG